MNEDEMMQEPVESPEVPMEDGLMDPVEALMDFISQLQEKYQMEQGDVDTLTQACYAAMGEPIEQPEVPEEY